MNLKIYPQFTFPAKLTVNCVYIVNFTLIFQLYILIPQIHENILKNF